MSGTLTTGKIILTQTTSNNDAFDRLRVSNPSTLFKINHSIGKVHQKYYVYQQLNYQDKPQQTQIQ